MSSLVHLAARLGGHKSITTKSGVRTCPDGSTRTVTRATAATARASCTATGTSTADPESNSAPGVAHAIPGAFTCPAQSSTSRSTNQHDPPSPLPTLSEPPHAHLDAHRATPPHRAVDARAVHLAQSACGSVEPSRAARQSQTLNPNPNKQFRTSTSLTTAMRRPEIETTPTFRRRRPPAAPIDQILRTHRPRP